jgi:hypothetical protein
MATTTASEYTHSGRNKNKASQLDIRTTEPIFSVCSPNKKENHIQL